MSVASTTIPGLFSRFLIARRKTGLSLGGRYDNLISVISDGAADLPAAGFAIGDVTFSNLLRELDHTRIRIDEAIRTRLRAFIIVADENRRPAAIRLAYSLRQSGLAVDYWFQPAKVGRQFQQAEVLGAEYAVVVGPEWPQVRVKLLAERRKNWFRKMSFPLFWETSEFAFII